MTGGEIENSAETAVSFVWRAQGRWYEVGAKRSTVECCCYCCDGNLGVHAEPWVAGGSEGAAEVAWAAED